MTCEKRFTSSLTKDTKYRLFLELLKDIRNLRLDHPLEHSILHEDQSLEFDDHSFVLSVKGQALINELFQMMIEEKRKKRKD